MKPELRKQRIAALAWSLHDLEPAPVTATGAIVRRSGSTGLAPGRWEPCSTCGGHRNVGERSGEDYGYSRGLGSVKDKFGTPQPCSECAGNGRVMVDPFVGLRVSTAEAPLAAPRTVRVMCDRCGGTGVHRFARCDGCDGAGQVAIPAELRLDEKRSPQGETALERRARVGSYRELETTLRTVRDLSPAAYQTWVRSYVTLESVNDTDEFLALGWAMVGLLMPDRVMVPADVWHAWLDKDSPRRVKSTREVKCDPAALRVRNRQLRERRGQPVAVLAAEFGLSESQVRRIVYEEAVA